MMGVLHQMLLVQFKIILACIEKLNRHHKKLNKNNFCSKRADMSRQAAPYKAVTSNM